MNTPLDWPLDSLGPLIVICTVTLSYVVFHYFGHADFLIRALRSSDEDARQARSVHLQRAAGVALLGVVPAVVALSSRSQRLAGLGLGLGRVEIGLGFLGFVLLVALPAIYLSARQPKAWAHYPLIRARRWTRSLYAADAFGWLAYLIAYEFFFRGFFLFSMNEWIGAWPAIAIVTCVYAAVHLPKNANEGIGSLVMGVVFGVVALWSGSIWGPVLGHTIIAVGNDIFVTRANPSIEVAS